MYKDNGRERPADKAELADLKGKHMKCPACGEYSIFARVEFAETKCSKCGTSLVEVFMTATGKAIGRR